MPSATYFLPGIPEAYAVLPAGALSVLFICQTCGRRWAQITVADSPSWRVELVPCASHSPINVADWGRVPGALCITPWASAPADAAMSPEYLPAALRAREFYLHLSHFEKESAV